MLNEVGLSSGARMARILLNLPESADFPNPWIFLPSLHLWLYQAYSTMVVDKWLQKHILYFCHFLLSILAKDLKHCMTFWNFWFVCNCASISMLIIYQFKTYFCMTFSIWRRLTLSLWIFEKMTFWNFCWILFHKCHSKFCQLSQS